MSDLKAGPANPAKPPGLVRVTTGSRELDSILGGGFPANSINIVMGEPGAGKTILAERLIFANAGAGKRPILYLATLSEPIDKLIRYLQQFSFYDEAALIDGIIYDSIGAELVEGGAATLLPKLREAIKQHMPQIIVIDSFKAIHDLAPSLPEMRRLLYEVAGLLAAYETTAFLVGEYCEDDIARFPEFTIADSMLALTRNKGGTQDERFLRVLKLRGSSYLEGLHAFSITSAGLDVYPRLISPELPPSYEILRERVPTGVDGLTAMLHGGPFRGTTTLVQGPTGSGKTTLALQFVLEGIKRGDRCLYVYFEENPDAARGPDQEPGFDVARARQQGLELLYKSPVELRIDSIISRIFDLIARPGSCRLAVDGVADLLLGARDPRALAQLPVCVDSTPGGARRCEHVHLRKSRRAGSGTTQRAVRQHRSARSRARRDRPAYDPRGKGARHPPRRTKARHDHRRRWCRDRIAMASALEPDDRRLGKLRKLTEVSRALTYALSLHEVLSLASRCACELLDADKALLLMTDDDGMLQVRAATGVDAESYREFREPLSEKVLGSIRRLLGSDAPHVLVVPLVVGGDVSGVLGVARAGKPLESDENEWLLSALADQAALALEKTRLDEAAQFREQLMGIVGHDLKNPVGAIRMATDMMLRSNGLDDRQAKLTRHIANSAARMADMISQLLDFAQSRLGGGIPIRPELVRAEDFCRQAVEELELAHPSGKLSLDSQSHAVGLWDRERLMQVISNLVSNAIQHGDADEAVLIRTFDQGPDCVIEVRNQGPPIPEHLLPHVFDPFRQGRENELRPASNLGLGLFIAQQIVAAHHGSITVTSNSQAGTTFTVSLPRRSSE